MAQTVIGFFDNATEANEAVDKLVSYGITRDRIDVSGRNTSNSSYSSSGDTAISSSGDTAIYTDDHEKESGITRFFKNLFGDDNDDADKYSRVASRSQSIVTVHATTREEAEEAADIMDDCGAVDVDERAAQYGYTGSGYSTGSVAGATTGSLAGDTRSYDNLSTGDRTSDTYKNTDSYTEKNVGAYSDTSSDTYRDRNRDSIGDNDSSEKLNVIEENIEIGKREVEKGVVRLRSRIVERPVEETVRLREERVNVERNAVDRDASDSDFSNFEEKDIEMVERSEVPVVNKQSRVVEEVSLNKEVTEREETIKDTVRNTEVDVEKSDKDDTKKKGWL